VNNGRDNLKRVLQVEPVHPVRQVLHKSPAQFPVQIHSLGKVQKPFRQPGLQGAKEKIQREYQNKKGEPTDLYTGQHYG
jgi:hypothetical protein